MSPSMTPIVVVVFDQLRADALGVATPNLDAFAGQAARWQTCITDAPLCRPARVSLISGAPVTEHGCFSNRGVPEPEAVTSHVRELRDAGYRTAVVGKTHLHTGRGHLDAHRTVLQRWGWTDAHELPDAQDVRVDSAFSDWLSSRTPSGQTDKAMRWRDYVTHARPGDCPDASPWSLAPDEHLDLFCATKAAATIEALHAEPLYLQVCFPGPHPPFDPPSPWLDRIGALSPAWSGTRRGPVTELSIVYRQRQRGWSSDAVATMRRAYFGKVALLDHAFGIVVDALRRTGLDERAWVIVTADHGELLGDHGYFGKVLPYESALRIPLLVRPPGGMRGWVDRGVAQLSDVTATVRSIAGLGPPGLEGRAMQGPDGALAHHDKSVAFANLSYVGIRTPTHTLTWDRRTGAPLEAWDRTSDPHMLDNRVEDPSLRPVIEAHGAQPRCGSKPPP